MGYQEECEAYALFGNPMRDAMDYEENARYDRWDGYKEEALACGDCEPSIDDINRYLQECAKDRLTNN